MAQLVAGQQHGHALRQKQRGDQVAFLLFAQRVDGGVLRRPFLAAVPAIVVIGAVVIVLAVGFVVLVVVADEVLQVEAIMARDEIDARERLAAIVAKKIGAAAERSEERRVGKECRSRWS